MADNSAAEARIPFRLPGIPTSEALSRAHGPASRGGPSETHELLAGIRVRQHFDLSAPSRAAGQKATAEATDRQDVVALEMEDGFMLYTSPGRLADDLQRLERPLQRGEAERDGVLELDRLRAQGPATRGVGDWWLRAFSVLALDPLPIKEDLLAQARELLGGRVVDAYQGGAAWAGAKVLTWAIERRLEREPGLYAWIGDEPASAELLGTARADFHSDWLPDQPVLVFIHGTGSSSRGSFGELGRPDAVRDWQPLRAKFGRHIYGFEHYTFSQSPIENALALVRALPAGARLNLVTHSRGGLVGELLCLAGLDAGLVEEFKRNDERFQAADEEDRRHLLELARLLVQKGFRIERYVRVACPAQGTLLAASHIDAFLSALLHLIGLVPGVAGTPLYAVVKRIVLEIAKSRTDPQLVPGIEAMLPQSPLTALIGRARPKDGTQIAVIAGDTEGGGLLKRLGVFLTDYLLFEEENNDLVVDTDSMFGGLARERARYIFDQGDDVSHFRYFANAHTRRVLQSWLTHEQPERLTEFLPLTAEPKRPMLRAVPDPKAPRPVVIFLPGIMGSHLRVGSGERVWLNFLGIALGQLPKIQYGSPDIAPDGLFEKAYGDLCNHLEESHEVRRFAYDWRRPLQETAALLAAEVEQALNSTQLPVRIMSHSMGGLVVRAMIASHRSVWERLVQREGARWVMLGTPNRGSHGTLESLLGLSETVRKLALLCLGMGLQDLTRLIAGFPGALQLLPRPGFRDTGGSEHDYYAEAFWTEFNTGHHDRWFGNHIGASPAAQLLAGTKTAWQALSEDLPNVDRIAYVAGYGHSTPCGIVREQTNRGARLRMLGTLKGDGTVTHDSSLLPVLVDHRRVWYMDADHGGLCTTADKFPALLELLERGETSRLVQERPTLRGIEQTFRYEAGPVLYPTEQDLERVILGGRKPVHRRSRAKYTLEVCVRAMDLRYARDPILVGHYEGDAISGAEAQIDRYLVEGALTMRYHLGVYSGPLGSVTVVLRKPNEEQAKAGIRHGAIVVGLGELGERPLTTDALGQAVRAGVLRYLLQVVDRSGGRLSQGMPLEVGLASVLLGHNSTASITLDDSISTIIRSVAEANRQFVEAMELPLRIGRLEFIELYEDVAISAAKATLEVAERLRPEMEQLGCRIEAAQMLDCGEGMRHRLGVMSPAFSYWPRMIITDAERRDELCPPECLDAAKQARGQGPQLPTHPERRPQLARKLRFLFLSQRARAETVEQQRQPGLVDTLVEKGIRTPSHQAALSRTLFQLLVPHNFKEAARQTENLVLVVDGYTANLPWEMLIADDEPLIRRTAVVRQLASTRFRPRVRATQQKLAYVVGNPSTEGYYTAFPDPSRPDAKALDSLPEAEAEARMVTDLLRSQGYEVVEAPGESQALDVINKLFARPYRILHISAHGVYQAGEGESTRSGVVLSDGLLLTAAEIGQLEVVPDLVFLNCCYSGQTDNSPKTAYNRLAYSVARELIEIGVRVVIAAGWAVRDDAARCFAETFYTHFLSEQRPFGRAVFEARRATYERFRDSNTWGAFQAYGDPGFLMHPSMLGEADGNDWQPVAPQELVERLNGLRAELAYAQGDRKRTTAQLGKALSRLLKNARAWMELPEVVYALARFHADAGDNAQARKYYETAIAMEDKQGRVPVSAIEQLANIEARQGADENHPELIQHGIDRLLGLVAAAEGAGQPTVNSERCAILGSAYKRLASVLQAWSVEGKPPAGVRQALQESVKWYQRGEGVPGEPGFSPYAMQNRLALQAVLGTAKPEDAALALRAGDIARERYATSRDYFNLIMAADAMLLARLLDGSLQQGRADAVEREIIESYRNIREQLPESVRQLSSVLTQLRLLAGFLDAKEQAEPGPPEPGRPSEIAKRLRRIADALEGIEEGIEIGAEKPDAGPEPPMDGPSGGPLDSGAPASEPNAPSAESVPRPDPLNAKKASKKSSGKKS
jgi:CHAT domain-containing protein/pimeloyl-ACP methyl ester carboxylesterase